MRRLPRILTPDLEQFCHGALWGDSSGSLPAAWSTCCYIDVMLFPATQRKPIGISWRHTPVLACWGACLRRLQYPSFAASLAPLVGIRLVCLLLSLRWQCSPIWSSGQPTALAPRANTLQYHRLLGRHHRCHRHRLCIRSRFASSSLVA